MGCAKSPILSHLEKDTFRALLLGKATAASLGQDCLASHNPANLLRLMQTFLSLGIMKCSVQSKSCFISLALQVIYQLMFTFCRLIRYSSIYYSVCILCASVHYKCMDTHVKCVAVRGQPRGVCSLLPPLYKF